MAAAAVAEDGSRYRSYGHGALSWAISIFE
jgi:hypothetical protein